MQKYTEEKTNEILGYNNSIVAMKKELEKKIEKSIYSENDVEERVAQSLNKTLEATQIKMYIPLFSQFLTFSGHVTIFIDELLIEANRNRKRFQRSNKFNSLGPCSKTTPKWSIQLLPKTSH